MTVRCRFHGWFGVLVGLSVRYRPIVDWDDGPTQTRDWDDLIVVP